MTTITIEADAQEGETSVTMELFASGSDTLTDTQAATEATNREGTFTAAFTDLAADTYKVILLSSASVKLASWRVKTLAITATYVAQEVSSVDLLTATQTSIDAIEAAWTTALAESYAADTVAPTPAQFLFMLWAFLHDKEISGMTQTSRKLDNTTAMTHTLDDATTPTDITRAT